MSVLVACPRCGYSRRLRRRPALGVLCRRCNHRLQASGSYSRTAREVAPEPTPAPEPAPEPVVIFDGYGNYIGERVWSGGSPLPMLGGRIDRM